MRFANWEDEILRREPSVKAAARYLPDRTLAAIKTRRRALKITSGTFVLWTPVENKVLRRFFPDFIEIHRRLPNRSITAIKFRARHFRLSSPKLKPRFKWTEERLLMIATVPDGGIRELARQLGATMNAVVMARFRHDLTERRPRADMSRAPPMVADVRRRVEKLHKGFVVTGAQHGAESLLFGNRFVENYRALESLVQTLGGEFYVEWDD